MSNDEAIATLLSEISSSHYDLSSIAEISPQEAEAALKRLSADGRARKTGSGNWVLGDEQPHTFSDARRK